MKGAIYLWVLAAVLAGALVGLLGFVVEGFFRVQASFVEQTERDKKDKFLHWLRSNGFLVVTKEGSPGDGKHYKATSTY
jgi:hypothetical protein